ncbi:glycosyltransferase family 2 protein [Bacteroides hominis]|jgi:glycosyltransferase involved in cell wall biosynthesis|uniref:glycosyltransferase family 2 protein n=1 Tax=Bacteroides hominis TaxID=2763023 RepID=UPI0029491CA5|nr:glycosyltransferase family 2 protein [Bacteroides hominis (ex Liu et al. 2022)]MDV6173735.1 glycosyltransferase family 2 protein [Bacteroides hominis (ex Liu et al. 2022)]
MLTKPTKASIITVNFNNRKGLSKTIHSVLTQTYPHIEYIIIDGGSTDGSKELIEQHTNSLYYWISEKDNGIYDAMNKGIMQASGEYCLFLNSGDYFLHSNTLSKIFSKDKYESDLLIGRQKFINSKGIVSKAPKLRKKEINMSFFLSSTIPHQATFIKRDLFHKCGLYNKEYHIVADWVFWIEAIIKERCSIKILPEYISYMENGGVSNNMDNCHAEMESYLKKCLKDGTLKWNDIFDCALRSRSQDLAMRHKITAIINKIMTWIGKYC